jgi:hypothetical protein
LPWRLVGVRRRRTVDHIVRYFGCIRFHCPALVMALSLRPRPSPCTSKTGQYAASSRRKPRDSTQSNSLATAARPCRGDDSRR